MDRLDGMLFCSLIVVGWAAVDWSGNVLHGLGVVCAVYLLMPYRVSR